MRCFRSSTAVGDNVTTERQYCGLYSYDIPTNSWHLLREDSNSPGPGQIRSRIGHSMLFYSVSIAFASYKVLCLDENDGELIEGYCR